MTGITWSPVGPRCVSPAPCPQPSLGGGGGRGDVEGPCRCPQVPASSGAAGRGAGVKHCPGPGCLLSTRQVFPTMGLDRCRKHPAMAWAWCRAPQQRQPCAAPAAKSQQLRMPRRWVGGTQGRGWGRRGSSQMTLGVPKGLPPPAGHKHQDPARNLSQWISGLCPFDLDPQCSKGSLHPQAPGRQLRHPPSPPNES